jgi:molecular chaperone DnaK (HSP70)
MAQKIGIDFGTTNTLISVIIGNEVKSFTDEKRFPHPSVVAYIGSSTLVGKPAKDLLDSVSYGINDNIIKSPKRLLGKGTVFIEGREHQPADIIRDLMLGIKQYAVTNSDPEDLNNSDFKHAVVSIPVAMNGKARKELRDAFLQAGIHIIQFVHEPLAALYSYLRTTYGLEKAQEHYHNKLALVFDWGGGTLDLTLCLISDGCITQVMNIGDNEVGGDYIDEAIVNYVLEQHLLLHNLDQLPPIMPGAKARLLNACEAAKIQLSHKSKALIYIDNYFDPNVVVDPDIEIDITLDALNKLSMSFVNRGLKNIDNLLEKLDIDQRRISLCLATGGMINMSQISQRLVEMFSVDRLVISNRGDKIISEGCAWIAADGCRLTLAKPVEVAAARQSFIRVFKDGTDLPIEGEVINEIVSLYCVDPRDGKAKIELTRPRDLGRLATADPRSPYDTLVLDVDSDSKPFHERLEVNISIDDNLILNAYAVSTLTKHKISREIYNLEFGLSLGKQSQLKKKSLILC